MPRPLLLAKITFFRRIMTFFRPIYLSLILLSLAFAKIAIAQKTDRPIFEIGPQITQTYLPVDPVGSVDYQPALGAVGSINIRRSFGIDSSISITPHAPVVATGNAGGRMTQFFIGGRAGISKGRLRIYGKLRPGFVSFGSAILKVSPPPVFQFFSGRLTEPALDVGGIAQFAIWKHFAAR
jgi:hypothetical protein